MALYLGHSLKHLNKCEGDFWSKDLGQKRESQQNALLSGKLFEVEEQRKNFNKFPIKEGEKIQWKFFIVARSERKIFPIFFLLLYLLAGGSNGVFSCF